MPPTLFPSLTQTASLDSAWQHQILHNTRHLLVILIKGRLSINGWRIADGTNLYFHQMVSFLYGICMLPLIIMPWEGLMK